MSNLCIRRSAFIDPARGLTSYSLLLLLSAPLYQSCFVNTTSKVFFLPSLFSLQSESSQPTGTMDLDPDAVDDLMRECGITLDVCTSGIGPLPPPPLIFRGSVDPEVLREATDETLHLLRRCIRVVHRRAVPSAVAAPGPSVGGHDPGRWRPPPPQRTEEEVLAFIRAWNEHIPSSKRPVIPE